MTFKIKEFKIYLDETIIIALLLCIIFATIREYFENYFLCYLFIAFHEFSHMLTASIFGIKTKSISINISGLHINLDRCARNDLKWFFIFLSGPLSNIILVYMFRKIDIVCTINLALAIINIIPIFPLDGYNICETLLKKLINNKETIKRAQKWIEIMVIILFVILGMYQFFIFKNLSIILMLFYIIIQSSTLRYKSDWTMYQKCYKNITKFQKNY